MIRLPLLTASRIKCYQRCQREHHYRYELGRVSQASGAQRFGTLVHVGLERWWRAYQDGLPGDALEAAWTALDDADEWDRARAGALLIGYDARWSDSDLTPLAVEAEFRGPLPGLHPLDPAAPWVYAPAGPEPARHGWLAAGKVDVLVQDGQRRVFVVEHKTSSEDLTAGSPYWARLRLDAQVSLYHLGAEALGHRIDGVIYDVIGKPDLRPLKATAEIKYTKEKTRRCKACNGGGRTYAPTGRDAGPCASCSGRGHFVTEPSRPLANQRLADETPEEYRTRLVEALAADPDRFFVRAEVVRLEAERAEYDAELRELARQMSQGGRLRNPDACQRYGSVCSYFPVCTGERRIDEYDQLGWVHPELTEDK